MELVQRAAYTLVKVGVHRTRLLAKVHAAWYSRMVVQMPRMYLLQVWATHSLVALAKGMQNASSTSTGSTQPCVQCWFISMLHGATGCMVDC